MLAFLPVAADPCGLVDAILCTATGSNTISTTTRGATINITIPGKTDVSVIIDNYRPSTFHFKAPLWLDTYLACQPSTTMDALEGKEPKSTGFARKDPSLKNPCGSVLSFVLLPNPRSDPQISKS